jgi:integrase
MGNADCGHLPISAVDLEAGWLSFPRVKTAVERRVPLWPETVKAIKAAIEARPRPKHDEDAGLLFVTAKGLAWAKAREIKTVKEGEKATEKVVADNPISKEMAKLLASEAVKIKRPGATFYALRHVFQTIGEESGDGVATKAIMGHAPHAGDMSAVYRERIADERLLRVVNHVRDWLLTADRGDEKEPEGGWKLENA